MYHSLINTSSVCLVFGSVRSAWRTGHHRYWHYSQFPSARRLVPLSFGHGRLEGVDPQAPSTKINNVLYMRALFGAFAVDQTPLIGYVRHTWTFGGCKIKCGSQLCVNVVIYSIFRRVVNVVIYSIVLLKLRQMIALAKINNDYVVRNI